MRIFWALGGLGYSMWYTKLAWFLHPRDCQPELIGFYPVINFATRQRGSVDVDVPVAPTASVTRNCWGFYL